VLNPKRGTLCETSIVIREALAAFLLGERDIVEQYHRHRPAAGWRRTVREAIRRRNT
jgi:hypothetical protein